MNKNIKWYLIIVFSVLILIIYTGYYFTDIGRSLDKEIMIENDPLSDKENSNKLPIPPLLEDIDPEEGKAEFNLKVQYGSKEFIKGYKTETLGYNGNYLGPTIKVSKGDDVKINVENMLNEPTTVHWHGLEVLGEMDGGPHQVIDPNNTWKPYFTIDQQAATLWYHPHLLHRTGEQVYKGLAGLFYIDDSISNELNIPKEYGINDIPLVIQDKRFTENGDIPYELSMRDLMNGFLGNEVLINGALNPQLDLKNEIVRLRLLNGSNARTYEFSFSNEIEFYQIASDGGFLENSIRMNKLSLAPAERAEILIDFSNYKLGDKITLRDAEYNLMTINIAEETNKLSKLPDNLTEIKYHNRDEVSKIRKFVMSGMGPMVAINGKQMNMDRIDEKLNLNELEEWVITNESVGMGMMNSTPHPFHIHGVQFQIIERNGKSPPLNERGWKDTVLVDNGEEVRVLAVFRKKGLFMYHCHILEHEDSGMMGQFLVE